MAKIEVDVVYALPGAHAAARVALAPGACLRDAIVASGLLERHPGIDLSRQGVGIFGQRRTLEAPLAHGDRVEIYRALLIDPKEARRRRAAKRR